MLLHYILKANDKAEIKIYDSIGRLVDETLLNSTVSQIEVSFDLNEGIYFYQIIVNERVVRSDKMIIN